MAGSGNVYRHDYDNVTPDFVWRTVNSRMDGLIAMARAELGLPPNRGFIVNPLRLYSHRQTSV